jgi:hypothetical protein
VIRSDIQDGKNIQDKQQVNGAPHFMAPVGDADNETNVRIENKIIVMSLMVCMLQDTFNTANYEEAQQMVITPHWKYLHVSGFVRCAWHSIPYTQL